MKLTVRLVTFCALALAYADPNDPTQIEKYNEKVKTYQLDVPGKQPITIIEAGPVTEPQHRWEEIAVDKDDIEVKNLMTHIVHDVNDNNPRCYGPSCQEGFNGEEGPQKEFDDYILDTDKVKDYRDFSKDRLEAITALAAKLKKDKLKADRYSSLNNDEPEDDDGNGKVYTSWNRLKVKQHKHPYDDKDGWVTLEPVAWSTSKISKWKPNIKKHKPTVWNDDQDRFPTDDPYNSYQGMGNSYNYPQKKPTPTSMPRPQYINNKLHVPIDYDAEIPSKPSWAKPQQSSFTSTWSPDESRRPHRPNCDSHESYPADDSVYYGISDSVVTDHRPSNFPHEYEALHQAVVHRPLRRPTQVVYAGSSDFDSDRSSRPPYGDGQWVLLSTTKGYRNKKRQRSLNPAASDDRTDYPSVTSHQAVALTVLPVDNAHTNMTTSHGGLLEVEKSFQTVEESKRDMDKLQDLGTAGTQHKPVYNRVVKRKIVSNVSPDSSTVLAAVGAGMVPATMAMVVPMMLGRRRRRDLSESIPEQIHMQNIYYRYQ
ncbi:uncharacterized protein LOC126373050 [Pectinophora gossypiella]|uniref:uncharacterized protein LOC126373050 n=1 Tax=Pectinophora gossypiella TaxID=13191 RepID=UPI00214E6F45|nr:uncharacterized protein LOC126373050 [Pectinophora gossypiella]